MAKSPELRKGALCNVLYLHGTEELSIKDPLTATDVEDVLRIKRRWNKFQEWKETDYKYICEGAAENDFMI